jgi:hypothetical protein
MSANIKASVDGTQAIIGVGGIDQMTVSNAGVVTANSFVGAISGNLSSATALATGSTAARSLANRFADVVNVKDFLCSDGLPVAGDGVHDDTTGIQNAINAGERIYIPKGIYKITSTLNISDVGKNIFGATKHNTTLSAEHINGPVIQIKQRGCRIEDLTITSAGTRLAYTTTNGNNHGIQVDGTNDSGTTTFTYIKCIIITNQPDCGMYISKTASNSIIEQVNVQLNKSHGFLLDDGTYGGATLKERVGQVNFNSCRSTDNGGNAVCLSPAGGSCYRIIFDNLEAFGNSNNNSIIGLIDTACYIRSQNTSFVNCGINSDTGPNFYLENGTLNFSCSNHRVINSAQILNCADDNLTGIYFDNFYVEPALTLPAFNISAGTTGVFIRAANSNNIPTMVTSLSFAGTYWISKDEYVIMPSSNLGNVHFHVNGVASDTIDTGATRIAAGTVMISGEGGVADSTGSLYPYANGNVAFPNGTKFTIVNPNAYNITINNGSGNIRTKTAANIVLGQYEAASFTTNNINANAIYFES